MKVLCLVIASDNTPHYRGFLEQWRRYAHSTPEVDTFFLFARPDQEAQVEVEGDSVYIRCEETLENLKIKTQSAFAYFTQGGRGDHSAAYDFILRTNLSSLVLFPQLLQACATFPPTRFCSAFVGDYYGPFPSGAAYVLTPDVAAQAAALFPQFTGKHWADDVVLGQILQHLKISIQPAPRLSGYPYPSNTDLLEWKDSSHYHIRFCSPDREKDVELFTQCVDLFYR